MYNFLFVNLQIVDLLLSIASRFIFMLGAHLHPDENFDSTCTNNEDIKCRTIKHRRYLFWLVYTLDKEMTFRTRRPPVINDLSCDLTLPKNYTEEVNAKFPEPHNFPGDIRLNSIKSRIYDELYSPNALRKSDAEILRSIRELDNDLDSWRMSLPADHRPTLSFSQDIISQFSTITEQFNFYPVMLRLEYHQTMATIHQASSRCKTWSGDQSGPTEGVNSSLAISVEASRSSLCYLRAARHIVSHNCFW